MEPLFQNEINKLKEDSLTMMDMSKGAVRKALQAIRERNRELALDVMDGDSAIDSFECSLDVEVLRLLALQQPVARDLRFIVGCLRIASNVERIGDEAVNIADRCVMLLESQQLTLPQSFDILADTSLKLLDAAGLAFKNGDADIARHILESTDDVTSMHYRLSKDLTEYMVKESRTVERALQMSFVAHSIHRICDRASNIAETVIFIVEGVNVKHHCAVAS
jgi:phosphate transport system protein